MHRYNCISFEQNQVFSKLSKNGWFLLNKVKKIICDQNFFHKIKIAQNVGFPHRFSFSGQKVTPMGLPDASGPPLAFGCLGRGRMGLESQRMTFWDPFRSHHVCLSVLLVYQDFCTFWTQPNDQCIHYKKMFVALADLQILLVTFTLLVTFFAILQIYLIIRIPIYL